MSVVATRTPARVVPAHNFGIPALAIRPLPNAFRRKVIDLSGRTRLLVTSESGSRPVVVRSHALTRKTAAPASSGWQFPEWVSTVGKVVAVAGICAALFMMSVDPAEAARSGGRVGGSAFRSSSPSTSYSVPSVPRYSYSYGYNSFAPSPFGFGFGLPVFMPVGGGVFSLLFTAFAIMMVFQLIQSFAGGTGIGIGGDRVAVAKLQVGLLGSARELQRDLDRIASRADTSTAEGLHYVLQETVVALQRNPDYWVYGASQLDFERDYDEAEARFNEMSLDERSKFRQETLSNFGGRSRQGTFSGSQSQSSEVIVVTILVAADVSLKLPKISSQQDMRVALTRIGSVPEQSIVAVEVLWTPQDPNDYYTRDEVMADYPELAPL